MGKTISLIFYFLIALTSFCNAIEFEVMYNNVSYILNTEYYTATLNKVFPEKNNIYQDDSFSGKFYLSVPKYIHYKIDGVTLSFIVTKISQNAFDDVEDQIYGLDLPSSIQDTLENRKACCKIIMNCRHIPVSDRQEISKLFKEILDLGNLPILKRLKELRSKK